MLPDTYDLLAPQQHRFVVVENRIERNTNFQFQLSGYTAFVNISSNNFTRNRARSESGLLILRGMEKELIMERNRWFDNKGNWVLKYDMQAQTIKNYGERVPAVIRFNYFENNGQSLIEAASSCRHDHRPRVPRELDVLRAAPW